MGELTHAQMVRCTRVRRLWAIGRPCTLFVAVRFSSLRALTVSIGASGRQRACEQTDTDADATQWHSNIISAR